MRAEHLAEVVAVVVLERTAGVVEARAEDLAARHGTVVGALAFLTVVVPDVIEVLLVELAARRGRAVSVWGLIGE